MAELNEVAPRVIDVAGVSLELRRAGQGAPLLILHGELGMPGWLEAHRLLAESYDVIVPSLPGWGQSSWPHWIMSVRDLAAWITWFARELDIRTPVNVVGTSLGGWAAAEIATIAPQFLNRLVLAGAMGVKPQKGEIFDYVLESGKTGIARNFHRPEQSADFARFWGHEFSPEEADLVEQHREMTCRLAWKPWMHSLTLPHLLAGVRTPTLVVWGREDAVTPLDASEIYARSIPRARLAVVEGCGHLVDMEKPQEFAGIVRDFLAG